MKNLWLFSLFVVCALFLEGCAISVPVQENTPPETLGAWGFRIYASEGYSPALAPATPGLQVTGSPGLLSLNEGVGLDIGILEVLDFQGYTSVGSSGSASKIGGKLQWLGPSYFKTEAGKWSASIGAHALSSNGVNFNSQGNTLVTAYFQNITGNGYDVENSFGYHFASWFGFYLGPKFVSMNIQGQYNNQGSSSGPFTNSTLTATGYGGFAGIFITPHSDHVGFEMTLEFEEMNFPGTFSGSPTWYPTAYFSMGFPFKF